jgi:hypothetical protein
VEGREQQIPAGSSGMTTAGDVTVECRVARPALPPALGWTEQGVDGGALGRGGEWPDDVQVHARASVPAGGRPPVCSR